MKAALRGIEMEPRTIPATEEQLERNPGHLGTEVVDTAHDRLRANIADMFEGDADIEKDITNLFPYSKRDKDEIDRGLAGGKTLLSLLKKKMHLDSDTVLSKQGLLDLDTMRISTPSTSRASTLTSMRGRNPSLRRRPCRRSWIT